MLGLFSDFMSRTLKLKFSTKIKSNDHVEMCRERRHLSLTKQNMQDMMKCGWREEGELTT